jgi:hypothetical protein
MVSTGMFKQSGPLELTQITTGKVDARLEIDQSML